MTDWGGLPRNINLNLPTDLLFKPTAKLVEWLERNTPSLRMLTEDQIIQRARAALGPDLARLNNGDLAAQIAECAKSHGFVVSGSGGCAPRRVREPTGRGDCCKTFSLVLTSHMQCSAVRWAASTGRI